MVLACTVLTQITSVTDGQTDRRTDKRPDDGKDARSILLSRVKTLINSVYPDLWPPRASRLQGLTVVQQYVYPMTFKNVYEFWKRLVKFVLVWSITLSILLSINGEIIAMLVFAQWANMSINFIAGS